MLTLAAVLLTPALAETAYTLTNTLTVDTRDNYGDFTYIDNGTSITITGYTFTSAKNVDVPSTIGGKPVIAIASGSFSGNTFLYAVTLPSSIISIGANAFSGCSSLAQAIFLGNAPTTVGAGIFASTSASFKVLYNGTATGFSSPIWQGYPSQALVPSTDVFADVELTCREREGIMDIVFNYLPTTLSTSPGVGSVRALYSLDGGTLWRPLRTATGDLGSSVPAGMGLKIVWNYAADGILTDPAFCSQIAIHLISTTPPGISEASTPAPTHFTVKPVRVNFCFGHAAEISAVGKGSAMHWDPAESPPSTVFSLEQQEQIRAETEGIYQLAGVTAESMSFVTGPPQEPQEGRKVINVFFTPKVGSVWGVCSSLENGTKRVGLDRFGKRYPQAIALIATNPDLTSFPTVSLETYQHPVNMAEVVAHEVAHGLGMAHIMDQTSSWDNIMDYKFGASDPFIYRSKFSTLPKPLKIEGDIGGGNHNETYYLLRWVEGLRNVGNLVPGEYDQENVSIPRPAGWAASMVKLFLTLAATPTLYDVKVLSMSADGEVGTVVREFTSLSALQLLDSQLETGGSIQIIASTTPGGEADVAIVPQAQIDVAPFSPVQGQSLKVLKYNALGAATIIGTGTTTSVMTSPIMPKNLSVKPAGFDGAHVQVEFECEPSYQYSLERSDDCKTWASVPFLTNIPGSNLGKLCLLDENAGQEKKQLFYRVRVNMSVTP